MSWEYDCQVLYKAKLLLLFGSFSSDVAGRAQNRLWRPGAGTMLGAQEIHWGAKK
jgi:hypothetical protein